MSVSVEQPISAFVPFGQHPALYDAWIWLAYNGGHLDDEQTAEVEKILRSCSSSLWEVVR